MRAVPHLIMRLNLCVFLPPVALVMVMAMLGRLSNVEAQTPLASSPTRFHASSQTPSPALPQVIATIQFPPGIGSGPGSVGVNPTTSHIYVANSDSDTVTVLWGTKLLAI